MMTSTERLVHSIRDDRIGMIDFVAGAVEETTEFLEHDESLSTKSMRSI